VYDVVQLPDDNAHDGGLNVPPALLSFHSMVPVGVLVEFEVSLTVTVSVTGDPGFAVDGFGDTVTVVESGVAETDVLLLSVNIILLLSAIAGITVKPPKSDEPSMQNIRKNGITEFRMFSLSCIFHLSDVTRLFFSYICSLKGFLR
jgi:hypothetical protein